MRVGNAACSVIQQLGCASRALVLLRSSTGDGDGDDDDGSALFRPYTPGEEDAVTVPRSSQRLFAIVLALPVLAILAGVATYSPTDEELRQELARKAVRLRGGGGRFGMWADVGVSVLVLLAVSGAAHSGSSLLAAVFSTAPTGVPLSLYLVHRATTAGGKMLRPELEAFLLACIKGVLALACFCGGALGVLRAGVEPSLPLLLAAGYLGWAAAWLLLQKLTAVV